MGLLKTVKDCAGIWLLFDGGSEIAFREAQQVRQFMESDMTMDDIGELVEDSVRVPREYKSEFGKAGIGVVLMGKHTAIIRKVEEKLGMREVRTVYVSTKTGNKVKKPKKVKKAKGK